MRIHILGVCGTFMGSLAQLAQASGHQVSGSDMGVYPPMSDQLRDAGIDLIEGYDPADIPSDIDCVIIGNAMARGNPSVEYILNKGIPYTSGPEWLRINILKGRWVAAVAGTHGKTTTSSMLAWILDFAGMAPGFLIGGVPGNFDVSARLGSSPFFVIEADEYDTAFFDKRSKFIHYMPRTLILNNLEFDHADIFSDLAAIEKQFHHLLRTVPGNGCVITPNSNESIDRVMEMGCWSERVQCNGQPWSYESSNNHPGFSLKKSGVEQMQIDWQIPGFHNISNAVSAILAARHIGVDLSLAAEALLQFKLPKRRLELKAEINGIRVFDDFAHHPTAIRTTLEGVKSTMDVGQRLVAVLEPRSNTMKMGHLKSELLSSVAAADLAIWFEPSGLTWSMREFLESEHSVVVSDSTELVSLVETQLSPGTTVVFMSNGSFQEFPQRIADQLIISEQKGL